MQNNQPFGWSVALRDMRGDRLARAGVREERLRATSALRGDPGLTSWRGRSGRRYVVGVHATGEADLADATETVLLAVRREGDGAAALLDVADIAPGLPRRSRLRWIAAMRSRGATEFHVHRLAETEAERRAVLDDLAEARA